MNHVRTISLVAVMHALSLTTANTSDMQTEKYACVLDGTQVVPPTAWPPAGRGDFILNAANELSYYMYDCLYDEEIAAHIHGPAAGGENAPIIFTLTPADFVGVRYGEVGALDEQQLHDLNCGLWYVDIHTTSNPDGAVRGVMRGLWGWHPEWPCFLPTHQSTWGAIKSLYR